MAIEIILPLFTIACATAPEPELRLTVGLDVYDSPPLVIATDLTGPLTEAVAVAPVPPPPTIVIDG